MGDGATERGGYLGIVESRYVQVTCHFLADGGTGSDLGLGAVPRLILCVPDGIFRTRRRELILESSA
jgi:hypothetical protein